MYSLGANTQNLKGIKKQTVDGINEQISHNYVTLSQFSEVKNIFESVFDLKLKGLNVRSQLYHSTSKFSTSYSDWTFSTVGEW